MKTNRNQGFTILELMIAVAIIGVLAAIAIPAYSNYINRAKVSEALIFAGSAETAVADYYNTQGSLPTDNTAAGLSTSMTATNVSALNVGTPSAGIITVTTSISGITNGNLTLSPNPTSSGITWTCTADSGLSQIVPANCR